jgi:uncharacterized protein
VNVTGNYHLPVPRERVWDALQDPAVLARTLPGCESLEVTGPDAYAATVTAGVASVKGTYRGNVELIDKEAPARYRLTAEGSGAPGTIRADAEVRLDEHEGGTTISYDAEAIVGGMIGGVGQRMLAGVAKKTAGEFFSAVERELVHGPVSGLAAPAPVAAPPLEAAGLPSPPSTAPQVGQVFAGAPPAVPGPERRVVELLAAAVVGAAIALVGVTVGRRLAR